MTIFEFLVKRFQTRVQIFSRNSEKNSYKIFFVEKFFFLKILPPTKSRWMDRRRKSHKSLFLSVAVLKGRPPNRKEKEFWCPFFHRNFEIFGANGLRFSNNSVLTNVELQKSATTYQGDYNKFGRSGPLKILHPFRHQWAHTDTLDFDVISLMSHHITGSIETQFFEISNMLHF